MSSLLIQSITWNWSILHLLTALLKFCEDVGNGRRRNDKRSKMEILAILGKGCVEVSVLEGFHYILQSKINTISGSYSCLLKYICTLAASPSLSKLVFKTDWSSYLSLRLLGLWRAFPVSLRFSFPVLETDNKHLFSSFMGQLGPCH